MSLAECLDYRVVFSVAPPGEAPVIPWKLVAPTILEQTASDHGMTVAEMLSKSRVRRIAYARFDAMSRLRAVKTSRGGIRFSYPTIGRIMGGFDHTTVINGVRRWAGIVAAGAERAA